MTQIQVTANSKAEVRPEDAYQRKDVPWQGKRYLPVIFIDGKRVPMEDPYRTATLASNAAQGHADLFNTQLEALRVAAEAEALLAKNNPVTTEVDDSQTIAPKEATHDS